MILHRGGRRLWATVLLLTCAWVLGAAPAGAAAQRKLEDYAVGKYPIGGDFTLINQDGGRTRLQDYRGKAVLLSFGYTHCPDVCPTTLALYKRVKAELGAQGDQLQVMFISVDPKRDTPAHLKQYVGSFDPGFLGLTGPPKELHPLIKRYMGDYRISDTDSKAGYAVDHTAFIYLIDGKGQVRYLFSPDVSSQVIAAGVQTVLAG